MPKFGIKTDYVMLRRDFINDYMLDANGAYVKVYLYALMLAADGEAQEQSDIAKRLNLLESDVKNAFEYWKGKGLLTFDGTDVVIQSVAPTVGEKSGGDIAGRMLEDPDLSGLCSSLIPALLQKPVTPADMRTIYWLYDELGFTPEMIMTLLEYCVEIGKGSVKYAEKVAITWNEKGINTVDKMEAHIRREKERKTYFYSIRKLMGISDRPLHPKEEEYLKKWSEDWKMGEDMVALAYEYCIMQTSKLSFPYMDTILENWNRKNIHDAEGAEKEHSAFKGRRSEKGFDVYTDDVDHSSLEDLTHTE